MIYNETRIKAIFSSPHSLCSKVQLLSLYINNARKDLPKRPNRREARNKHRNRGFALEELDNLDDTTFQKMFRLDRFTFDDLVDQFDTDQ